MHCSLCVCYQVRLDCLLLFTVCVLPGETGLCIVQSLCYQMRLDCALFTVCVLPGEVELCIVHCVCVTR